MGNNIFPEHFQGIAQLERCTKFNIIILNSRYDLTVWCRSNRNFDTPPHVKFHGQLTHTTFTVCLSVPFLPTRPSSRPNKLFNKCTRIALRVVCARQTLVARRTYRHHRACCVSRRAAFRVVRVRLIHIARCSTRHFGASRPWPPRKPNPVWPWGTPEFLKNETARTLRPRHPLGVWGTDKLGGCACGGSN